MGVEPKVGYTVRCDRCRKEIADKVGRNEVEAEALAKESGGFKWSNGTWTCGKCMRMLGSRL